MNHSKDQAGDHHGDSRQGRTTSPDLDILLSHPSLTDLSRQGWQLDRLPITSTGWAFAATILASMVMFGSTSALLVVVMASVAIGAIGYALTQDDLRTARDVLHLSRACLATWVLAGFVGLMITGPVPEVPTGTPESVTTAVTTVVTTAR